jgi:hypothetical protein
MPLQLKDRVLETASAPGTGTVTLLGASLGYQSFNTALTSGNTTYYAIADLGGANWEVGIGTFTSPNQLARNTILESSGGGSIVNFSSGTQNVFITYPAEKSVNLDASGNLVFDGTTTTSNLKLGNNLDTNGQLIIGGNYGGNQLSLPVGFGPFLQGLYEGNVNLRAGAAGSATGGFTLTSDGALGLGTSPNYGTAGQILTSGGTGAAATWATISAATVDDAYFLSFMMG